jgi:hypothetical protein
MRGMAAISRSTLDTLNPLRRMHSQLLPCRVRFLKRASPAHMACPPMAPHACPHLLPCMISLKCASLARPCWLRPCRLQEEPHSQECTGGRGLEVGVQGSPNRGRAAHTQRSASPLTTPPSRPPAPWPGLRVSTCSSRRNQATVGWSDITCPPWKQRLRLRLGGASMDAGQRRARSQPGRQLTGCGKPSHSARPAPG